jgi:protein-tyrosine phosphatase
MHQVSEHLFFSGLDGANAHEKYTEHGIESVVRVTGATPASGYPDKVSVRGIEMPDSDRITTEQVTEAAKHVLRRLRKGETVLVHCTAGNSRSPCVAAVAHSIHEETLFQISLNRVYEHEISPKKPVLEAATGAVKQLEKYDKQ